MNTAPTRKQRDRSRKKGRDEMTNAQAASLALHESPDLALKAMMLMKQRNKEEQAMLLNRIYSFIQGMEYAASLGNQAIQQQNED